MTRTVNETENAERRRQILDAAGRLIYSKGYEAMSLQDVLDAAGISKGAFYHYYDSKQALLHAFVDRLSEQGMRELEPVVDDPALPASVKLQRTLSVGLSRKTVPWDRLLPLLRAWYGEGNLCVRVKANESAQVRTAPLIARIVRQGVAEGAFDVPDPEVATGMLLGLGILLSEGIAKELLAEPPTPGGPERILALADSHARSYERILGAATGTIRLFDPVLLKDWLTGRWPAQGGEAS